MTHYFDPIVFGSLLEAARIAANYRTRSQLADALRRRGLKVKATEVRAWEGGAVVPNLDETLVLLDALEPRGGMAYFAPAVSPILIQKLAILRSA
jgi:hypothetical protein